LRHQFRMKNHFIPALLLLFVVFAGSCLTSDKGNSNEKSENAVACNNTVCDTITTYRITHLQGKDTLHYNYTYNDTIELKNISGEIYFENFRCKTCKGNQYAYIVDGENKTFDSVMVMHNGNAVSKLITLSKYSSSFPGILKIQWEGFDGKSFYVLNK